MRLWKSAALAAWFAGVFSPGAAGALETQLGDVLLSANGALSGQGGAFKDVDTGRDETSGEWDASVILNAEYVASNGLVWGARLEFDTGDRQVEDLERDEIYVYLAGGFGRLELGEQDGPADTISLHAPTVGLGQIRGDFVRYTGSPALLSAFDTRDDLKIVYLSPPIRGFRWGASYAPKVESNADATNPRRRTRQENAYELAAAYQVPVGAWALSASGAYVGAEADPITERGDISSWSAGVQATRDAFSFGAAYVDRGESNSLDPNLDQDEWNAGLAWREDRWGLAASASITQSSDDENRLVGVGGYYELNDWWIVRADAVSINEEDEDGVTSDGYVGIVEVSFQF